MHRISEDIHDILVCKLYGGLNTAEEADVNALLESDDNVRRYWEDLRTELSSPKHRQLAKAFSTAEVMVRFREKAYIGNSRKRNLLPILAMVAVLVGVVAGAYLFLQKNQSYKGVIPANTVYLQLANGHILPLPDSIHNIAAGEGFPALHNDSGVLSWTNTYTNDANCTLVVPEGKNYSVKLADGSLVHLNALSSLHFPFSFNGETRDITLNGEAYVNAAPSGRRPLILHINQTAVLVLGTTFNVNSYHADAIKVSLVSGSVKVSSGKQAVTLLPGYQANVSATIKVRAFNQQDELGWLEGKYRFSEAKLVDIIPILERLYGVPIRIDDPVLANKTFTGEVNKSQPIAVFLDMLHAVNEAKYYYQQDTIHIKKLSQPMRH